MKTRQFFIVFITVSLLFSLFCAGASASDGVDTQVDTEPENSGSSSLRYPVVLVHGIALRDPGYLFNSWGKIPHLLRANGVEVYFGDTDAWGTIESNAGLLRASIDKILEETGKEKVNIIAHSKGGLDSRYLIWKYEYGDKVASLTTISTPHHGSVVADMVQELKIIHTRAAKRRLEGLGRLYNDVYPEAYAAGYELTTKNMDEFNKIVTMDDRVYYQSIYSIMNKASDDPLFAASYKYIKDVIGDNDGLVSEYSARWGENVIKIDGGISHGQIINITGQRLFDIEIPKIEGVIPQGQTIDIMGRNQLETKVLNVYLEIVKDLTNRGF
jgi:triacylglycerol esterase/lipase EstA (alpha/beta hydrolase family)